MATPLTDMLYDVKDHLQHVIEQYPEDACGSAWLEQAQELVGRAADEVEAVEDPDFAPKVVATS